MRANGRRGDGAALDLLIVGCGPAGLSASLNALHHGLHFRTIERESEVGGAVRIFPRTKLVMTSAIEVPGYGKLRYREIRKEKLIDIWDDIRAKTGFEVTTGETVTQVKRKADGLFTVETTRGAYRARRVILAIGRRGVPRKLELLWSTSLLKVEPDSVVYRGPRDDLAEIPNDYLFVFIGGELPTPFLRTCGVEIETKFGEPESSLRPCLGRQRTLRCRDPARAAS